MSAPLPFVLLLALALAFDSGPAEAQADDAPAPGQPAEAFSCSHVLRQAEARIADAVRELAALPACPAGHGPGAGELEELRSRLEAATAEAEGLRQDARYAGEENERLRVELDGLLVERMAAFRVAILALMPAEDTCETLVVEADGTTGLIVSGQVEDPAALRRQVDSLGASAASIAVDYSALSKLEICGVRVGEGLIAEAGEDGEPKLARREDVGADRGAQVPRAADCATVGEVLAVEESGDGADRIEAFWVLREGQDPAEPNYVLCRHGRNTDQWLVYETNLTGATALVILRPEP